MRAIASPCHANTRARRRLRWRLIGFVIINFALWVGIIWSLSKWF